MYFGITSFYQPSLQAQNCDTGVPSFTVNLNNYPNLTWQSPSIIPNEQCCGIESNYNCLELIVTLPPDANSIRLVYTTAPGNFWYYVNCSGKTLAPSSNILNLCFDTPGSTEVITFCRTGSQPFTFTIAPVDLNAMVTLEPFDPVCVNSAPFPLQGGSPANGRYLVNGEITPFFIPSYWGPGNHDVTYIYEDPTSGCTGQATRTLRVVPLPVITWSGQAFCDGGDWGLLNQAGPPGGVYSGNFVVGDQFNIADVMPGNFPVTYTYTDIYGCSAARTAPVVIHALPIADAGPDQTIPSGTNTFLAAQNGGTGSYSYQWTPSPLLTNPGAQGTWTTNLMISTLFNLTVQDNTTGCQSQDQVSVLVTGGALHISRIRSSPAEICLGDNAVLSVLPGGGSGNYNYSWSAVPADPSLVSNAVSPTVSPSVTTTYNLIITDNLNPGLLPASGSVVVQVNPLPNVSLVIDPTVCANTPNFALYGGSPPDGNYFMLDHNQDPLDLPYINFSNFLPHRIGEGDYFVRYEYTDAKGCSNSAIRPFEILPYVKAEFYASMADICISNEITILDNSVGADIYEWDFESDGIIDSYTNLPTFPHIYPIIDNIQDYTIKLTTRNNEGCSHTRSRKVTVHPPVIAQFSVVGDDAGCSPHTVTFQNESEGQILFYFWEFGDGTSTVSIDPQHTFINHSDRDTTFTVSLTIVSSNFFCSDTYTYDITVYPYIEAGFTHYPVAGCHPLEIEFNSLATGATGFHWDFGNGNTSADENPPIQTFINTSDIPIEYTIWQYVNNQHCTDSLSHTIEVYPEIYAGFSTSITEGCSPLTVDFTNLSSFTASTIEWDFGDGGSSLSPDTVSHTFINTTDATITYRVWLRVRSDYFCEDSLYVDITVHPYIKADFNFNPAEACNPHEVNFYNRSYGVNTYIWDFGDGFTSNTSDTLFQQTYDHNDPDPVTYQVTLTVSNGQGCSDVMVRPITIFPKIEAGFTPSATEGCNKLEVTFANNSTGVLNYRWEFGDGGSSTAETPVHIFENTSYTDPAIFDVWLFVESEYLCKDSINQQITVYPALKADFAIETVEDCSPFVVNIENYSLGAQSYTWDFGDGNSSPESGATLSHTFFNTTNDVLTHTIRLEVRNSDGCIDTLSQVIKVFPEVVADFTSVAEGCHPLEVSFTNQSQNAQYYQWSFGDGNTSYLQNPVNLYYNNNHFTDTVFQIDLLATSAYGCFTSISTQVRVLPKPNALFNIENSPGCSPHEIIISNNSLGVDNYFWNFGDGSIISNASSDTVYHTYNHPHGTGIGYFNIRLMVDNSFGCSDTLTQQAEIYPAITASFSSSAIEGCHPLTVDLTNNSTGADASLAYYWNYGNGNSSHNINGLHSHTFTNFSHTKDTTFTVTLIAQNVNSCTDTTTVDITVFAKPMAYFNIPQIQACAPHEINVHNFSVGAETYDWSMGDGTTYNSAGNHFMHTYYQPAGTNPGLYTIQLDVENLHGCTHSYSEQLTVYPEVFVDFTFDDEGCHPHSTAFANNSVGAGLYYWNFGNGNTSQNINPEQTFLNYSHTDSRTYTITLRGESTFGCFAQQSQDITLRPQPKAEFNFSELAGCSPFTPTISNLSTGSTIYQWELGNGQSDRSDAEFTHTWNNLSAVPVNYNISLNTWNEFGCLSETWETIQVFPEVNADFLSENDIWEGCSPLTIRFLNDSNLANTYIWDFADGNTSSSANPINTFRNSGTDNEIFAVEMIAKSLYGCTDTIRKNITVLPTPVARFNAQPYRQPYPNTTITLTNETSPGNWNYHWEFGDGNFTHTTSYNPFDHSYVWIGPDMSTRTYTVALIASNSQCSDIYTQEVTITSPVPLARFDSDRTGCEPLPVQFYNSSLYAHSYRWDFDDGSVSHDPDPVHTFIDYGIYNVRLIAIGDGGSDTTYVQVEVFEKPKARFELESLLVKIPEEPLVLINNSVLGDFYLWNFGDGTTSNAFEPVHYYRTPGIYDISLTVTRDTQPQCHDTLQRKNALRVDETCLIIFPNAFKPLHSGPNGGYFDPGFPTTDVFHPVYEGVDDYVLEIYSRWGELLYRSEDINKGWDGYVRGQLSKMDVYVWKVTGRCTDGRGIMMAGDVTLYR